MGRLSALSAGKHTIVFDFKYDGPGPGKGGTGVLSVDGKEVDRKTIAHTIPLLMAIDETFDVGVDTRTPVDDFAYERAVPLHWHDRQAELQTRAGTDDGGGQTKSGDDAGSRQGLGEACGRGKSRTQEGPRGRPARAWAPSPT